MVIRGVAPAIYSSKGAPLHHLSRTAAVANRRPSRGARAWVGRVAARCLSLLACFAGSRPTSSPGFQPRPRPFTSPCRSWAHSPRCRGRGALGRVWRFPARLRKDGPQSREDRRAQGERRGDPPEALRKVRQAHREGGEGRRWVRGPGRERHSRQSSCGRVSSARPRACRAKPEARNGWERLGDGLRRTHV